MRCCQIFRVSDANWPALSLSVHISQMNGEGNLEEYTYLWRNGSRTTYQYFQIASKLSPDLLKDYLIIAFMVRYPLSWERPFLCSKLCGRDFRHTCPSFRFLPSPLSGFCSKFEALKWELKALKRWCRQIEVKGCPDSSLFLFLWRSWRRTLLAQKYERRASRRSLSPC